MGVAVDALFLPANSISDRFPGLSGLSLLEAVNAVYKACAQFFVTHVQLVRTV